MYTLVLSILVKHCTTTSTLPSTLALALAEAASEATSETTLTLSLPTETSLASLTSLTAGSSVLADGGLRQESVNRQELLRVDVDLLVSLERARGHSLLHLHGKHEVVDRSQNLINLTDLSLVVKEDSTIEVRDLLVCALADHLILTSMHHLSDLDDLARGTCVEAVVTTTLSLSEALSLAFSLAETWSSHIWR